MLLITPLLPLKNLMAGRLQALIITTALVLGAPGLLAQVFPVDTILYNGPSSTFINLVILPDGYQEQEMPKFKHDAQALTQNIFKQSPFLQYKTYFNVFSIRVPSPESGVKHPNTVTDCPTGGQQVPVANPNNYFGSTMDAFGIHRLVVPMNSSATFGVLASSFPEYDQVFMLVNSPHYGGSGGVIATSTTNSSAAEIAIHEIGHSFATLADEYWAGSQYAAEKANMTRQTDPGLLKWRNWLGHGGVGSYPHQVDPSWYRPHANCKMQVLGAPFCPVCAETLVERVHDLASPLREYSPRESQLEVGAEDVAFSLQLINPNPNTLRINWVLNDRLVARQTGSFMLQPASLPAGRHQLSVSFTDTTLLTRSTAHATSHLYVVAWEIVKTITGTTVAGHTFQAEISLYPNPSPRQLALACTLERPAHLAVEVLSVQGQSVSYRDFGKRGRGEHRLDLQDQVRKLPAGAYLVRAFIDGHPLVKRFIKE